MAEVEVVTLLLQLASQFGDQTDYLCLSLGLIMRLIHGHEGLASQFMEGLTALGASDGQRLIARLLRLDVSDMCEMSSQKSWVRNMHLFFYLPPCLVCIHLSSSIYLFLTLVLLVFSNHFTRSLL